MGLISARQTIHPEDAYSLGVFLQSAWPDTHSRTAPRGYKFRLARSVLFIVLTTWIEISYSESSYKKLNTSRYAQGVQCADGVSFTQEEHNSIGICFEVFYRSCADPAVYCSAPRSSEGEQVNAPHGVREFHAPHAWGNCVRRTHSSRTP